MFNSHVPLLERSQFPATSVSKRNKAPHVGSSVIPMFFFMIEEMKKEINSSSGVYKACLNSGHLKIDWFMRIYLGEKQLR